MSHADIMARVGDAYLPLIHPELDDPALASAIARIAALDAELEDQSLSDLIAYGESWRERLVGLVLATLAGPAPFAAPIFESLHSPRGIAVVPAAAVLVLAVSEQPDALSPDTTCPNRNAFDGEVGWSWDKSFFTVGAAVAIPKARGQIPARISKDTWKYSGG